MCIKQVSYHHWKVSLPDQSFSGVVKSGRERTSYFGQYCVRIEEGVPVTGNLSAMIVASEFDQDVRRLTADDGFHQGIIVQQASSNLQKRLDGSITIDLRLRETTV